MPRRLIEHLVSTGLLFLILQGVIGAKGAWDEGPKLIAALLASFVAVPAAMFAFHFITAFHGLALENLALLREQYADAQAALADKDRAIEAGASEKNKAIGIAASLTHFKEKAIIELLNRRVQSDDELAKLVADIGAWEKQVLAYMEQAEMPPSQVSAFRVLGAYNPGVSGGFSAAHNRELAMLWERIRRLTHMSVGMDASF